MYPTFLCSQNRSIHFENTSWKQILEKAKKEKKPVFLDCYTAWCGPCKEMEKTVFTNDSVADFYNASFICARMDMEKGEGFSLVKKYNIHAYPSLLYLNATGEILHMSCGQMPPRLFIETGKDALDPKTRLSTYARLFNNSPSSARNAYAYLSMLENACQSPTELVTKYFTAQSDSSLISYYNWNLIYKYAGYSSKAYQYLELHKDRFIKLYGRDSVDKKINFIYALALQEAHQTKNKKEFESLKAKFTRLKTQNSNNIIQHAELKLVNTAASDLKNAILINDSIIGPVNVGKGFGAVQEFHQGFEEETNSTWFKLEIKYDTLLSFDLVPIDSLDDYDFSLYKYPDANPLNMAKINKVKPVRACHSYCTSKSGVTGLSKYATEKHLGAGSGPAYASAIPVKAGEIYYLVVNYPYQHQVPLGFSIYFYNYWPKRRSIPLEAVFFENGKSTFSKKPVELDKLAALLKSNQMKIEVRGHTDDKGNETENKLLSEQRAKAVVDYLIAKNISADRLFYKGYGSTKPIATNETEEGRKKNRRVEFVVVFY